VSGTCEILLFQVGPRVFAAVVHDAVRIGSVRDVPAEEIVLESALGTPFDRARGIVVACDEEGQERTLVVDHALGIRSVPESDVHPLPAFAAACLSSGAVTGFVVVDEAPTLLIDLRTLLRERPGGAAPQKRAA
jgi:chemotaxis signal transduction protein